MIFTNEDDAHHHSLRTLNLLAQYQDFLMSIDTMCDMGCGSGKDLEWWATLSVLDDNDDPVPLNIKCTGVDLANSLPMARNYSNIDYTKQDFETMVLPQDQPFDLLWSHDSFQYAVNPVGTLKNWNSLLDVGGMLVLVVPTYMSCPIRAPEFSQLDYQYHNHTIPGLMHMLAVNGFEVAFVKKDDMWINIVAYKTEIEPMDPKTTRWYHLAELELLPKTVIECIDSYGYVRQDKLVLEWLDRSLHWFGQD
jgi:SAM-dependent methyltransferase